jgi:hypothetical protein
VEEGDLREVHVAMIIMEDVYKKRVAAGKGEAVKPRRTRKSKANGPAAAVPTTETLADA